ncbi:MAG: penicillin acylase family protein [Acidobacteria bacterium]|nr:penicillin acylase family protein [Acidobacteriota bacterium]
MRRALPLLLSCALAASAAPKRGVEILWDTWGVAHVFAKDKAGLFFGYGYAQMQSHGNLILKLYGESRGRSSEYWGPGANNANLALDRWVLTNDIAERGEQWYQQQTPEFKKYLDAFADGMNEYAKQHPDKLDEAAKRALPITGADPVIHTQRIMHFSYVSSAARVNVAATGRGGAPGGIGSNAWAIAPAKSASGKPMILMNPHLPWMDWYTYYEIHLTAPGINLYGASQVGFPVLRFSLSDNLAFTQTVNSIDGSDLYRIMPDGDGYRYDGAKRDFAVKEKTLAVRQSDGSVKKEPLRVKHTVHGPVVWDSDKLVLAQRTTGLDRPFALEQYWKMAIATNFADYQAQLKRLEVPSFNITYADKAGHVMYMFNGLLPKRSEGDAAFWGGVIPGDQSKYVWTGYHSYDELPKVIDPPSGFVQNTNDPPWSSTWPQVLDEKNYPAYTHSGRPEMWRTTRSLRMLTEQPKISFDELVAKKHSTRLEFADRVIDALVAAVGKSSNAKAQEAAKILAAWDRQTDASSRGALLFELIAPKLQFAMPLDLKQPFETPRGLKQSPEVLAKIVEDASAEAAKNYGRADAPWGDYRRLKRGATDLPASGGPGALGAFRVLNFAGTQPSRSTMMGDTFVLMAEFGGRAVAVTSYGNSSQPGSKHSEDQLPLVRDKKTRPVLRLRKEVEANLESKDVF